MENYDDRTGTENALHVRAVLNKNGSKKLSQSAVGH